jgi:hypothetical protein
VKVTVEGGGGLLISGAGGQEVRLRPGSYKLRATKDGKPVPLERDLVTIARGDREIVRLRLEGEAPAPASKGEVGAFVVMGGTGVPERRFDTLAEAVQTASDGDTIEVRGDGPFVTRPISAKNLALTIRAGEGHRPVIELSREAAEAKASVIWTNAALVLEGLELRQSLPIRSQEENRPNFVQSHGAPFYVANCRFPPHTGAWDSPLVSARNCMFLGWNDHGLIGSLADGARWRVDNCVFAGTVGLTFTLGEPRGRDIRISLTHNSLAGRYAFWFATDATAEGVAKRGQVAKAIRIDALENIFDSDSAFLNCDLAPSVEPREREAMLRRLVDLRDLRNLYSAGHCSVQWSVGAHAQGLVEWKRLWGEGSADPLEGRLRFRGGDLLFRAGPNGTPLEAEDFRLRPDSAGYRTGEDRRDLGADVDLVGPGKAYERWKKTPAYQQWLKDTKYVEK